MLLLETISPFRWYFSRLDDALNMVSLAADKNWHRVREVLNVTSSTA